MVAYLKEPPGTTLKPLRKDVRTFSSDFDGPNRRLTVMLGRVHREGQSVAWIHPKMRKKLSQRRKSLIRHHVFTSVQVNGYSDTFYTKRTRRW